jgi:hypothetical protein
LIDGEEKDYMHWRREGDTYEPPESDDEEGAVLTTADLVNMMG